MSKISGIASKSSPGFFMTFDFKSSREHLQSFDFEALFRSDLNWSNPTTKRVEAIEINAVTYQRRMIAQVAGVAVYEVVAERVPGEVVRQEIYRQTVEISAEHLLIFVDEDRSQSYWYWVKRDGKKQVARHLSYYRGQSGDLILGKLGALVFELEDFERDDPTVMDAARRLQAALDVERVTKKFYGDFKVHLEWFVSQIQGIDDEGDRRWYASVILNRLMFVYFLQYKGFVDGNEEYLRDKLEQFEEQNFYTDFLKVLFFEGFAKAKPNRSAHAQQILGEIKYLNGGLFLEHRIEKKYQISIGNEAFKQTLDLFEKYSWNLDDSPGGKDDEIRPEVLGYIFEKYINQKEFGAYYTRPEITEYLCDRTINKLILDKVNAEQWQFESIEEVLFNLDADLCLFLLEGILPKLSLLDPACGSGAFLVAAMKTLINVYSAVIGRITFVKNPVVTKWLKTIQDEHSSIQYYIKKRIITDNLYGVDIMEEATEITKLRLFLALVASATKLEELEPLPNVDFNIMAGNSLIGLIRVDEGGFNDLAAATEQGNLLSLLTGSEYPQILEEKNRSIQLFKERAFVNPVDTATENDIRTDMLKSSIEELNGKSQKKLNQLLLREFQELKIKYEAVQVNGKSNKDPLEIGHIDKLEPFHWGYHFDQVMERGGFDAIIANPPWEVFQTNEKEFFRKYSPLVQKKKLRLEDWETQREILLEDKEIQKSWLDYSSAFPHQWAYFKKALNYKNQTSTNNGKAVGSKPNLYSLFVEQCFNLLKTGGECGFVIASGICSDLGTKQLREMLFNQTQISSLISLDNTKGVFEEVDSRYKFVIISFQKGGTTKSFPGMFMVEDVSDLELFDEKSLSLSVQNIRDLSPNSLSIKEIRNESESNISTKLFSHAFLSDSENGWGLNLYGEELNMTRSHKFFLTSPTKYPLYEGSMIHQFTHKFSDARYWIEELDIRESFSAKRVKRINSLKIVPQDLRNDYEEYRIAIRKIARGKDSRTLISAILPPYSFAGNSLSVSFPFYHDAIEYNTLRLSYRDIVCLNALLNSFVVDYVLRSRVNTNLNIFHLNELPIPRLTKADRPFQQIVDRAAKLICTTPDFDDLAAEVGLSSHTNGATDPIERAHLRAELDGIIAHLYGLTEFEFAHILSTFPIVPQPTKDAALQAYRDFTPPQTEPEILNLLQQGESNTIEFKSTARWNLVENKKDRTMEEVILKTISAFLNTQGGTLLIGVADDSTTVGLELDYQTLKKRDRDGFELWLMNDLLIKEWGKPIAANLTVTFHTVDHKDICRITIDPAPEPIYVNIRDKSGQPQETLFIRTGNSTNKLEKPSEITKYIKQRWN